MLSLHNKDIMGNHTDKSTKNKGSCVAQPQMTHLKYVFTYGSRNTEEEVEKSCKRQRSRVSSVRLYILKCQGHDTYEISTWLPEQVLSNNDTNRHANMEGDISENPTSRCNVESGRK